MSALVAPALERYLFADRRAAVPASSPNGKRTHRAGH